MRDELCRRQDVSFVGLRCIVPWLYKVAHGLWEQPPNDGECLTLSALCPSSISGLRADRSTAHLLDEACSTSSSLGAKFEPPVHESASAKAVSSRALMCPCRRAAVHCYHPERSPSVGLHRCDVSNWNTSKRPARFGLKESRGRSRNVARSPRLQHVKALTFSW